MALRVVADVDENLPCVLGHFDPLEQAAGRRPLLDHGGEPFAGSAVRVPHGVRAAVGDAREQGLSRERRSTLESVLRL